MFYRYLETAIFIVTAVRNSSHYCSLLQAFQANIEVVMLNWPRPVLSSVFRFIVSYHMNNIDSAVTLGSDTFSEVKHFTELS
jgi:hypothetical protein